MSRATPTPTHGPTDTRVRSRGTPHAVSSLSHTQPPCTAAPPLPFSSPSCSLCSVSACCVQLLCFCNAGWTHPWWSGVNRELDQLRMHSLRLPVPCCCSPSDADSIGVSVDSRRLTISTTACCPLWPFVYLPQLVGLVCHRHPVVAPCVYLGAAVRLVACRLLVHTHRPLDRPAERLLGLRSPDEGRLANRHANDSHTEA